MGCIGDTSPVIVVSDVNGCGRGSIKDNVIKLYGINSIVGRTLVLHSLIGVKVGMGVIGRSDTKTHRYSM